jgi:hypothetical protein
VTHDLMHGADQVETSCSRDARSSICNNIREECVEESGKRLPLANRLVNSANPLVQREAAAKLSPRLLRGEKTGRDVRPFAVQETGVTRSVPLHCQQARDVPGLLCRLRRQGLLLYLLYQLGQEPWIGGMDPRSVEKIGW